mmetsp:Transcript_170171/g.545729  ORF Transcript_170171/g.545729 Transcript_170171/m.545729 type:complete len:255 (+) Transcript_170171:589-1353(+)
MAREELGFATTSPPEIVGLAGQDLRIVDPRNQLGPASVTNAPDADGRRFGHELLRRTRQAPAATGRASLQVRGAPPQDPHDAPVVASRHGRGDLTRPQLGGVGLPEVDLAIGTSGGQSARARGRIEGEDSALVACERRHHLQELVLQAPAKDVLVLRAREEMPAVRGQGHIHNGLVVPRHELRRLALRDLLLLLLFHPPLLLNSFFRDVLHDGRIQQLGDVRVLLKDLGALRQLQSPGSDLLDQLVLAGDLFLL